ncbi:hypothetical protein [Lysinibacillus sphaericus]|uniref:hypothetical protein n=1 Tax=Lysinibacillus sphaericus TaxID=1421 RepID=UPI003D7F8C02
MNTELQSLLMRVFGVNFNKAQMDDFLSWYNSNDIASKDDPRLEIQKYIAENYEGTRLALFEQDTSYFDYLLTMLAKPKGK